MSSLQTTDDESAAVQKTANRVTLDSLYKKVGQTEYFHPKSTPHMTICAVTLVNGFVVVGQAAPADAANYDVELGRKFAFEDALRKVWPLEGYLLRERLHADD